jgi:hypothetical protein
MEPRLASNSLCSLVCPWTWSSCLSLPLECWDYRIAPPWQVYLTFLMTGPCQVSSCSEMCQEDTWHCNCHSAPGQSPRALRIFSISRWTLVSATGLETSRSRSEHLKELYGSEPVSDKSAGGRKETGQRFDRNCRSHSGAGTARMTLPTYKHPLWLQCALGSHASPVAPKHKCSTLTLAGSEVNYLEPGEF